MELSPNLEKTIDYVQSLKRGDHGVFFYGSTQEKRKVLFEFLQTAFRNDEGAVYVASNETTSKIGKHMEDFGLDVNALQKDGALRIVDYGDFYLINGEPTVTRTQILVKWFCDKALEAGFKGLRICGEVACFFEHGKEKDLMELELATGRRFQSPVTALCAYEVNHARSLEQRLFFSLIKAHGPVITRSFAQEVKLENFLPVVLDEALETIFGRMGREAVLRMLDTRRSSKSHSVAKDPDLLVEGLRELLGSGEQTVTWYMAKQMRSKIGVA